MLPPARLLRLDALADPEILRGIFSSAEENDLLRDVLPLVAAMAADADALVPLFEAAEEADLVPRMLALSDHLGDEERALLAGVAAARPELVELAGSRGLSDLVAEAGAATG